jgi:hypothetical protein
MIDAAINSRVPAIVFTVITVSLEDLSLSLAEINFFLFLGWLLVSMTAFAIDGGRLSRVSVLPVFSKREVLDFFLFFKVNLDESTGAFIDLTEAES